MASCSSDGDEHVPERELLGPGEGGGACGGGRGGHGAQGRPGEGLQGGASARALPQGHVDPPRHHRYLLFNLLSCIYLLPYNRVTTCSSIKMIFIVAVNLEATRRSLLHPLSPFSVSLHITSCIFFCILQ